MTGKQGRGSSSRRGAGTAGRSRAARARQTLHEFGQSAGRRFGRTRAWLSARPRLVRRVGYGTLVGGALFGGIAVGSWSAVCRDCPSVARIYVWEPKSATQILDRDGKLVAQLFQERRTPIDLNTLPPYVPQAFIAIEDKRFYRHNGFDLFSLVGSNVRNVLRGRRIAGASTITQQLARWMFSDEIGFERYITRKMKELKVALELERVYTKDQILEAYINQVNYGDGRYGIESASQYFFGKPAVELQPVEAALLAAVINLPTRYSPFRYPERALNRRNTVLRLMAEQGFLTREQSRQLLTEPLPERPHRPDESQLAPYFVELVRDQLDDRYGDQLYNRGFRVTTTLDIEMQRHARAAMDTQWARIERMPGYAHPRYADIKEAGGSNNASETQYLQGMFIALDPASGEIRALIGGRDFEDSKFNRAVQALRQPGSTFKPFVYTAAIASGMPASNVIYDSPIMLEMPDSTIYSPRNYDPDFRGPLTLRDALRFSVNTVAVKLGLEIGLETVSQTARRMGIRTPVGPYPSTSIGGESVIPIQIVEAYTPFATTGMRVRPRSILRVEDQDGRLLWETFPEREQVLDSAVAAIVRDLLRTALDAGSGAPSRAQPYGLPFEIPAAGKTGTTNDATDVWFIGFTPDMLAGVWFGFDRPKKIVTNAAGGTLASPAWGRFMRALYYDSVPELPKPVPWPWPQGITTRVVDRETGKLASTWCDSENTYTEYFIEGTEPTEVCESRRGLFFGPLRRRLPDDTVWVDTLPRIDPRRRWH